MTEHHELLGGKVHVYKRENSDKWQCSTFLGGRNWRVSTKQDSLLLAKEFAEDWYLTLRGKYRAGEVMTGKRFDEAAQQFLREFPVITQGQRNKRYVEWHEGRLRNYLLPFFGQMPLSEITSGKVQDYRDRNETSQTRGPDDVGVFYGANSILQWLHEASFVRTAPHIPTSPSDTLLGRKNPFSFQVVGQFR